MFKIITKEMKLANGVLKLETGKIARQAEASVIASLGDTSVLCTVTVNNNNTAEHIDFLALTVQYLEKYYAAGKFPKGFVKRETKPSEREVLVSRLIDRSIRPLFPSEYEKEIQVICTVLSYDEKHNPDVVAAIGASAALWSSGLPLKEPIAAVRVAYLDNKLVLNPGAMNEEEKVSQKQTLDLIMSGTESSIMMVESEASELSDQLIIDALSFGHEQIKNLVSFIRAFANECGSEGASKEVINIIKEKSNKIARVKKKIKSLPSWHREIKIIYKEKLKSTRYNKIKELEKKIIETLSSEGFQSWEIHKAFSELKADHVRSHILKNNKRMDGRDLDEIRKIECEVDLLPRAHGSALFTRGETQVLSAMTLGNISDEQLSEDILGSRYDRFTLHYNFPPYSVGEVGVLKAPGRREIGHGRLAYKALLPLLPSKEDFPYAMRVVAEVTESNGSSSMASVCSASILMMASGIPIKRHVAGIAMGLVKEKDHIAILSDIMGDEDHLGDMDFKVAGTENGITALQMDIKVCGIDLQVMKTAIEQAKKGIKHILEILTKAIDKPRSNTSIYAPQIRIMKVERDKIRDLIGPGGKVIRDISEQSKSKIDIEESGKIRIFGHTANDLNKAVAMITEIAFGPEVGKVYDGCVVKMADFGLFVRFGHSSEGMVHVSEIFDQHVASITEYFTEGDLLKVKILAIDRSGKIKLTMKGLRNDIPKIKNDPSGNEVVKKPRFF